MAVQGDVHWPLAACLFIAVYANPCTAETKIVMVPVDDAVAVTPQIIGGDTLQGQDWPATRIFQVDDELCTSTLVGERTVITAAHCLVPSAPTEVLVSGKAIELSCDMHPNFERKGLKADVALCLAKDKLSTGESYERLSLDSALVTPGTALFLVGYGCPEVGVANKAGVLYGGKSMVQIAAHEFATHIETDRSYGGVMLCKGDSGGGAFKLAVIDKPNGRRRVVGVNSGYNFDSTRSYITSLSLPTVTAFIREWAELNKVTICGVHSDANNCR